VEPAASRRRDKLEQDEAAWVFTAADREVDLRGSLAYDKLYHTNTQRAARFAKAAGKGLVSAPLGLAALATAKCARRAARGTMKRSLALLDQARLAYGLDVPPEVKRGNGLAALKDALLSHPVVDRLPTPPAGDEDDRGSDHRSVPRGSQVLLESPAMMDTEEPLQRTSSSTAHSKSDSFAQWSVDLLEAAGLETTLKEWLAGKQPRPRATTDWPRTPDRE
jgi:hypothetical protein